MMETVLLAIGPGEEHRIEALAETAASMATPNGRVVVLHVFDRDEYDDIEAKLHIDRDSETTPDDVSRRSRIVSELVASLDERDTEYDVRGALGTVSDAILRVSDEVDADGIVVGGRGRSATGKVLFGSTAQSVMQDADCPVTFVKERPVDAAGTPSTA